MSAPPPSCSAATAAQRPQPPSRARQPSPSSQTQRRRQKTEALWGSAAFLPTRNSDSHPRYDERWRWTRVGCGRAGQAEVEQAPHFRSSSEVTAFAFPWLCFVGKEHSGCPPLCSHLIPPVPSPQLLAHLPHPSYPSGAFPSTVPLHLLRSSPSSSPDCLSPFL